VDGRRGPGKSTGDGTAGFCLEVVELLNVAASCQVRRQVMDDRRKDDTLVEQTISRLLDFHGIEIAKKAGVERRPEASETLRASKTEHLDLAGAPRVFDDGAEGASQETRVRPVAAPQGEPFAVGSGVSAARQRTMAMLVPILSIVLLFVLNKFYNVPFLRSEWLRLGTYRVMIADFFDSGAAATDEGGQRPVKLKVRGIALSNDRPSAVIGTTIVHEGDTVLGATVVRIGRAGVEFEVNGESWTQKVQ
jgi:hypothetical protein